MSIILDIILIIIGTIITFRSYKSITFNKTKSVSDYVIIVIYVFCIIPIIFDYLVGVPTYQTVYWYKVFYSPMINSHISIIYDIYILLTILLLYFYSRKQYIINKDKEKISNNVNDKKDVNKIANNYLPIFENSFLSHLFILLPVLLIIFTGTINNYLTFNLASTRGLSENVSTSFMSPLLLLSLFTFFCKYYKKNITLKKLIFSLPYFFLIVWISGKRFMLANIILLLVYYVCNNKIGEKSRKKLYYSFPILLVILLSFSAIYLTKIRPLSNTTSSSVYEMLRVDFGRDDVIKYVIDQEVIKGSMILDYRGETFLSMILFWIPRKIWFNKPYPHYRYLTSSILLLPINQLPAGTTPSWFEMCICNFGILGFILAPLLLILFCKCSDSEKSLDLKALYIMLLTVLLTQCMDVYVIYILVILIAKAYFTFFKNRRVRFVWR